MREAKSVELSPPENRYAIDPQLEPYIERLNAAYCRVGERVLREGRDVSFVNRCPCCGRIVCSEEFRAGARAPARFERSQTAAELLDGAGGEAGDVVVEEEDVEGHERHRWRERAGSRESPGVDSASDR